MIDFVICFLLGVAFSGIAFWFLAQKKLKSKKFNWSAFAAKDRFTLHEIEEAVANVNWKDGPTGPLHLKILRRSNGSPKDFDLYCFSLAFFGEVLLLNGLVALSHTDKSVTYSTDQLKVIWESIEKRIEERKYKRI